MHEPTPPQTNPVVEIFRWLHGTQSSSLSETNSCIINTELLPPVSCSKTTSQLYYLEFLYRPFQHVSASKHISRSTIVKRVAFVRGLSPGRQANEISYVTTEA